MPSNMTKAVEFGKSLIPSTTKIIITTTTTTTTKTKSILRPLPQYLLAVKNICPDNLFSVLRNNFEKGHFWKNKAPCMYSKSQPYS